MPTPKRTAPTIKPEVLEYHDVTIRLPKDTWHQIEEFGKNHLRGSSGAHICTAAVQLYHETEIEPVLLAAAKPPARPPQKPDLKADAAKGAK